MHILIGINFLLGAEGIKQALLQQAAGMSLTDVKVTTLQNNLDSLIPGLAGLLITLFVCGCLRRKYLQLLLFLDYSQSVLFST